MASGYVHLSKLFGTNNIAIPLIFFLGDIYLSSYRTDIYLSVLLLVISDISQYKTL